MSYVKLEEISLMVKRLDVQQSQQYKVEAWFLKNMGNIHNQGLSQQCFLVHHGKCRIGW